MAVSIVYDLFVRTTLAIDDDVLQAARCVAEAERVSLGEAVSRLARRGMSRITTRIAEDGFPIADVPECFPLIDDEYVRRAMADFP